MITLKPNFFKIKISTRWAAYAYVKKYKRALARYEGNPIARSSIKSSISRTDTFLSLIPCYPKGLCELK